MTAKEQAEPSRRRVYGCKAAFILARVLILVAPHLQTAGLGTGVVLGCPTLTVLLLLPASNSIVPKWRRFPIVGLPVRYRLDRVSGKSAVKLDTGSHWTKDSLQCSCVIKIHDDPSLAARENNS